MRMSTATYTHAQESNNTSKSVDEFHISQNLQCENEINETLAYIKIGFGSFMQITTFDFENAFLGLGYACVLALTIIIVEILWSTLPRKMKIISETKKVESLRRCHSNSEKLRKCLKRKKTKNSQ